MNFGLLEIIKAMTSSRYEHVWTILRTWWNINREQRVKAKCSFCKLRSVWLDWNAESEATQLKACRSVQASLRSWLTAFGCGSFSVCFCGFDQPHTFDLTGTGNAGPSWVHHVWASWTVPGCCSRGPVSMCGVLPDLPAFSVGMWQTSCMAKGQGVEHLVLCSGL